MESISVMEVLGDLKTDMLPFSYRIFYSFTTSAKEVIFYQHLFVYMCLSVC